MADEIVRLARDDQRANLNPLLAQPLRQIDRLVDVLGVLVEGITAGRFPARPGEEHWQGGWEHCHFCEFDRVCQADRDRAWERVQGTAELAAYVALAEGTDG